MTFEALPNFTPWGRRYTLWPVVIISTTNEDTSDLECERDRVRPLLTTNPIQPICLNKCQFN